MAGKDDSTNQLVLCDSRCEKCGGEIWAKPKLNGAPRKRRICDKWSCKGTPGKKKKRKSYPERIKTRRTLSTDEAKKKHSHVCIGCGKTFVNWRFGKCGSKYCSRDCSDNHFNRYRSVGAEHWGQATQVEFGHSDVYFAKCESCNSMFSARTPEKRFCSSVECRKAEARRYTRDFSIAEYKKSGGKQVECLICGTTYTRIYGIQGRTCSKDCADELKRRQRRIHKAKRRAKERADNADSIDPFEVFERDGWRCQLCGKPTPRNRRGTLKPNAPELDHIITLADGGDHVMTNVQCSCRRCNQEKGAQSLGQLILI